MNQGRATIYNSYKYNMTYQAANYPGIPI